MKAKSEFNGHRFSLAFFCGRNLPHAPDDKHEITFFYEYKIVLRVERGQPLDWHMQLASLVREFFMLLVGSGVYTLELVAFPSRASYRRTAVGVLPTIAIPTVVRLDPRYFYTQRKDISDAVFESALNAWLAARNTLLPFRSALSDLLTVDGISPEEVFSRIAHTLDFAHDLLGIENGRFVTRGAWRDFTNWLAEQFDATTGHPPSALMPIMGHRDLVIGRVRQANSLSFQSKLENLFGRARAALLDLDEKQTAQLIPRIANTRHQFAHAGDGEVLRGAELESATLICWGVLMFTVCRYLGMPTNIARGIAASARETMFLVRRGANL